MVLAEAGHVIVLYDDCSDDDEYDDDNESHTPPLGITNDAVFVDLELMLLL